MKVAIIGRSELMYETIMLFEQSGFEIACIVTAKEAPEYEYKVADFVSYSKKRSIPYLVTSRLDSAESDNFFDAVGNLFLGVSVNFSGIIPQQVIDRFSIGILNAHGGDLPRYRGNACQAWALINGEERIGLCIHKMIGGELDSGDIIDRDYLPVSINTKIGEVWDWMNSRIPTMFLAAARKLNEDPAYVLEVQSKDPKDALRCYPRRPEDARIDWSRSSQEILRLINASGPPYAGAFSYLAREKVIILDAELVQDNEVFCAVPGQLTGLDRSEGSFTVATGDGKINVTNSILEAEAIRTTDRISSIRMRLG